MKMSLISFLTFLFSAVAVYLSIHYFVYWRIAGGLGLAAPMRNVLKIAFLALAASFFLAQFFRHSPIAIPIGYVGAVWMGIISIALSVFIIQMFFAFVFPRYAHALTLVSLGLVVLASGYSLYNGLRPQRITTLEIPIPGLPESLSGFSIVQIADIHLDRWKSARWLESIVDRCNELHPDLMVIVGDLIDEDIRNDNGFVDALRKLKSPNGVLAVTGNHEYYAGVEAFFDLCQSLGITVIRNSCVTIADSIDILGVDDQTGKSFMGIGADLDKAAEHHDPSKPAILLSHEPLYFDQAVAKGVSLELSGHVHAGQLPPMDAIVMLYYKYAYGLFRVGSSHIYTSSGTGTWAPPMRLFSRSEIVKIVLHPA